MYKLMIVDDNIANLTLAKKTLEKEYRVQPISSGAKALEVLRAAEEKPDLILLDLEMPGMDGFDVMRAIKADPALEDLQVIFLTATVDAHVELQGLTLGAVDYIVKPFSPPLLKKRVELHLTMVEQRKNLQHYSNHLEKLVQEKTQNVVQLQYSIIYSIADLIDKKDHYTGGHTDRVGEYTKILLEAAVRSELATDVRLRDVEGIALASKLHDVGKIAIPDMILLKDGRLSPQEYESIKRHSSVGADSILHSMLTPEEFAQALETVGGDTKRMTEHVLTLTTNEFLKYALTMARYHHERWNGAGYPDGLAGSEIPFLARIVAIADVYDALRSVRPYKDPFTHDASVGIIKSDSGKSFDAELVECFLSVERSFHDASVRMKQASMNEDEMMRRIV